MKRNSFKQKNDITLFFQISDNQLYSLLGHFRMCFILYANCTNE